MGTLQLESWRRLAKHYGQRLLAANHDQLAGRDEKALADIDELWPQIDLAHERVLSVAGLDDGTLAYIYFVSSAELARRQRPTRDQGRGAGAALRFARAQAPAAHAEILTIMGIQAHEASSLPRARALLKAAVRILRRAEAGSADNGSLPDSEQRLLATALRRLGDVEHDSGKHAEAESVISRALAVALRTGAENEVTACLNDLASVVGAMRRFDDALGHYEQALSVAMRRGEQPDVERALGNMADVLIALRRLPEARRAAQTALDIARALGDLPEQARRLNSLAGIELEDGDPVTAAKYAHEALQIAERQGDLLAEALALHRIGEIHERSGREWDAVAAYERAARSTTASGRERLRRHSEDRAGAVRGRLRLLDAVERMEAANADDDKDRALASLSLLADELREAGHLALGLCLHHLGRLRFDRGEYQAALQAHEEALRIDGAPPIVVLNLRDRALALHAMGDVVGAVFGEEQLVAYCNRDGADDFDRYHHGLALARLGNHARTLRSYHAARVAYQRAAVILRETDDDAAEKVDEALAQLAEEQHDYCAGFGVDAPLPRTHHGEGIHRILTWVRDAGSDLRLTIVLHDGRTVQGPPAFQSAGVVPLLSIRTDAGQVVIPLERVVSVVATDGSGRRVEITPEAAEHASGGLSGWGDHGDTTPDGPADFDRAEETHSQGVRLIEMRRYSEAIPVLGDAVRHYRAADSNNPSLAMALTALSVALHAAGRREEALVAARESYTAFVPLVGADPATFQQAQATAMLHLGVCLWEVGRHAESASVTADAITVLRNLAAEQPATCTAQFAAALDNQAAILARVGRAEEAVPLATEAVGLYRRLADEDPNFEELLCHALDDLAIGLVNTGDPLPAVTAIEESVTRRRKLHRTDPLRHRQPLAETLDLQAGILGTAGHHSEARAPAEEAVQLYRSLTLADNVMYAPKLAGALTNLGAIYDVLDLAERSLAHLEQALRILRGPAHEDFAAHGQKLATLLAHMGTTYTSLRRWNEAVGALEEAEQVRHRLAVAGLLPPDGTSEIASTVSTATDVAVGAGNDPDLLIRVYRLHSAWRERMPRHATSEQRKRVGMLLHLLGARLGMVGRCEEAVTADREAIPLLQADSDSDPFTHLVLAGTLANLAGSLSILGRLAEAEDAVQESIRLYRQMPLEADHPGLATALTNLDDIRRLGEVSRRRDDNTDADR